MTGEIGDGIAAALDDVGVGEDEAEQLALLDDGLPGPLVVPDGLRRPGRPAGAKNRSTEAWKAAFLAQRRDPALVLADLYSRSVEQLAKEAGIPKLEALKLQVKAAEAVLPYVHSKQPLAVKVDAEGLVQLVIAVSPEGEKEQAEGAEGGLIQGEIIDQESEENQ